MKFPIRRKLILLTVALSLALTAAAVFISYALFSGRVHRDTQEVCENAAEGMAEEMTAYHAEMLEKLQVQIEELYRDNTAEIEAMSRESDLQTKQEYFEQLTASIFPMQNTLGMSYEKLEFLNEYRFLRGKMNVVLMSSDLDAVELVWLDEARGNLVFLADGNSSESPLYHIPVSVQHPEGKQAQAFVPGGVQATVFDALYCTSVFRVRDLKSSVYVVVQAPLSKLADYQKSFIRNMAGVMLAVMVILGLVYVLFADRFVVGNIRRLSRAAHLFTEQMRTETDTELKPVRAGIRTRDEMGELSRGFDLMQDRMLEYIGTIGEKTAREESIRAELSLASRIQSEALPESGFEARGFRIDSMIRPARAVGGDLYDYFLTDENHLFFAEADVSGKGVPAALFMMRGKELIKAHASAGKSPGEIAKAVNAELCKNNEEGLFITAFFGILELSSGLLRYARAGHEQPFLIRDSRAEKISEESNFVLGLYDYFDFEEDELQLQPGDRIVIFTDGLDEGINPRNDAFGYDRIRQVLEQTEGNTLPALFGALDAFADGAEQFDDVTLLQLTAGEKRSWVFENPEYRNIPEVCGGIREALAGAPGDCVSELCMMTDEIMNNCVSYAYEGISAPRLAVDMTRFSDMVCLRFTDNGSPFNPLEKEESEDPDRPEDAVGGWGIRLVRMFSDETAYENRDGNNILCIKKTLRAE